MNYQRQVTSVFPSPSKIPYGGFSPVRLQTEIYPPPSQPPPRLSAARIPPAVALISGQKPSHPNTAAHRRANRRGSRLIRSKRHSDWQNQAIPSRGPWLPSGLCCPAGSMLTMASCAPLALTQPLMNLRSGPPAPGAGEQEGPQFTRHDLFIRAIPRTPVDRPVAFGCCFTARNSLRQFRRGSASTRPRPLVLA